MRHTPEGSQQHRRRIGLVRSGGRRASPTYVQFESVAGVDILPKMTPVAERRWNWLLWAGFLLSVLAFFSYFFFFAQFPLTRNFPWANLLLFAFAAGFLAVGILRAFRRSELYRGKVLGPILAGLTVLIFGAFAFLMFIVARQLPSSSGAPRAGAKVPDFTLMDTGSKPVSLTELLTAPVHGAAPKGVMLVFYRGYW